MNKDIGTKIRKIRESKHVSQSDLSKMAGIAQSTLSYIENGKKSPQFDTLSSICNVLKISVLKLLTYEEQEINPKLFEEGTKMQSILSFDHSKTKADTSFLNNLPSDAIQELYEFEKYLFLKYKQRENE